MIELEVTKSSSILPISHKTDVTRKYHLEWNKIIFNRNINRHKYIFMIIITSGTMISEYIIGLMYQSVALQADAFNMMSDVFALTIGFYSLTMSQKNKTDRATFGYLRAEIIGGIINAMILLTSCFFISIEALNKIIAIVNKDPSQLLTNPIRIVIVGSIGLFINIIGIFLFGQHGGDINNKSIFFHILGDLLSSVAVVISALIIEYGSGYYRYLIDPIISVLIVIMIVILSIGLLKHGIHIVLHLVPLNTEPTELRNELNSIPNVKHIHSLDIWSLDQQNQIGSMHFAIDENINPYPVIDKIKAIFHKHDIHYTTIQPEKLSQYHQCNEGCSDVICQKEICINSELNRIRHE
jgi:cation diffusion facilitator family transporter